ncbi:MAG: hypothetical protein K5840_03240 [Eubacterium sp.]|nr:hypothetical protein [Eubacterium sp.]
MENIDLNLSKSTPDMAVQFSNQAKINSRTPAPTAAENTQVPDKTVDPGAAEEKLKNVVSVSDDGDTVQVRSENEKSATYSVSEDNAERSAFPPPDEESAAIASLTAEENTAAAEETATAAEEPELPEPPEPPEVPEFVPLEPVKIEVPEETETTEEIISAAVESSQNSEAASQATTRLSNISDQRLEQMYVNGEISRYTYDTEMAARAARLEEARGNLEDTSEEIAGIDGVSKDAKMTAEAIQSAFGGDTDAKSAAERIEAMENITNPESDENARAMQNFTVSFQ